MGDMNKPTIITTPNDDQMAVIPLTDYERLVEAAEDLADVRAYDEATRRLAAGEDELVPAEIVNRILDGENALRVWREHRGLTVKQLADQAGVSAPFVSQIETGQREGSVETMRKLASVLKVSLDELVCFRLLD
jgi:DNA-binding XRE family transcriptional regulator/PHD/YefM family antitoxin component YafN of YafNO toxin-antitoxin module